MLCNINYLFPLCKKIKIKIKMGPSGYRVLPRQIHPTFIIFFVQVFHPSFFFQIRPYLWRVNFSYSQRSKFSRRLPFRGRYARHYARTGPPDHLVRLALSVRPTNGLSLRRWNQDPPTVPFCVFYSAWHCIDHHSPPACCWLLVGLAAVLALGPSCHSSPNTGSWLQ
jgi:hypothetical protein